jgi:alkylation response protein AidB-like acyl-CoA dehydrogenase
MDSHFDEPTARHGLQREALMHFDLTDEQRMTREMVRDFAEKEVEPSAQRRDHSGEFSWEIMEKMGPLGLLGLPIPEEYGGAGADTVCYVIAIEELARVCGSTAITVAAHTSLGTYPLYLFGTEDQRRRFLPPLVQGQSLAAFALTEPQAGSDARAIRTRAVLDGNEWVIDGQKVFITNGAVAETLVVSARTDACQGSHGISNIIVTRGAPGFRPGRSEEKMGLRSSVTSELFFENCRVPEENLLGKPGDGFRQCLATLDGGRISIGAMALGLAQGAYERARAYASERVQFGQPIAKFQAIQWMLADMATEIDAARLLVYRAAWRKDSGHRFTREAAMAKLYASEVAERVCFNSIQIHGGYGYMKEYDVERMYRDQRLCTIGEGTSEIQRLVIARQILGNL